MRVELIVVLCEINWIDCKSNWIDYGGIRCCEYICVKCIVLGLLYYVKGICELRWGIWGVRE